MGKQKYIFITGGVMSSLGKGIVAATVAALLKARGFNVRNRKLDPYFNVDPGTLSPFQHGEVFVTDDGAETDLDLGHYERFADTTAKRKDSVSSGRIYWNVLTRERQGGYGGRNIQLIPEVTDEVKKFLGGDLSAEDFVIYEVGGTIGEDEGFVFVEGVRQFINNVGRENAILIHLSYAPFYRPSEEVKTKPTQQSVRMLMEKGLIPHIIIVRSENRIAAQEKKKISMFCNVSIDDVVSAPDVKNIYEIPLIYHDEKLDDRILAHFNMDAKEPDLTAWRDINAAIDSAKREVIVGVVAKYCGFSDAYKSVCEAIAHAGIANKVKTKIKWINAEELEGKTDAEIATALTGIDAMIVPGGFGVRGVEGKIAAAGYARKNNVPYLGICLGMQVAVIEIARNLLGIANANSTEFAEDCTPIVAFINEWKREDGGTEKRTKEDDIGGTLRLGAFRTILAKDSVASKIYGGATEISERHRHRYEIDISYEKALSDHGVIISGKSPDGALPEILEIPKHKFFVAGQFHPEFKSRPFRSAPLFDALIKSAL
ncbi:MAG: CTP synthase [Rickettsiales bacterium]|jgi:CTP synthase|nr:CTP synthase [Rickettsiales bacterium]